jgi:hypothetical protein
MSLFSRNRLQVGFKDGGFLNVNVEHVTGSVI